MLYEDIEFLNNPAVVCFLPPFTTDLADEDKEEVNDRRPTQSALDDNLEDEVALLDGDAISINSNDSISQDGEDVRSGANIFEKFIPLLGQKRLPHAKDTDKQNSDRRFSVKDSTSRNRPDEDGGGVKGLAGVEDQEDDGHHDGEAERNHQEVSQTVGEGEYEQMDLENCGSQQYSGEDFSQRMDNVGSDNHVDETDIDYVGDQRGPAGNEQMNDLVIRKDNIGSFREIEDGISQQDWRQFICSVCKKACYNKQALYDHQKTHTFLQCGTCLLSFLDEESLALHEQDHKERPFFCGTCGKTYKSHFSLKEHEYSHTGHRPFICPYCPKGFMRNKKLKLHMKKAHQKLVRAARKPPPSPLLLAPDEMPSTSSSKELITQTAQDIATEQYGHDKTADGSFECETCHKIYPSKKGLERHAKIHQIWGSAASVLSANSASTSPHDSDNSAPDNEMVAEQSTIGPRPFKCQLCESTFLEESHLQTHVEIHSMDGPWACIACRRQFKQRAHLLEHMYIHWGYKPYICLYCPMDFKRTYEAEKHMNLHKNQERRKKVQQEKMVSTKSIGGVGAKRGSEQLESSVILHNLLTTNSVPGDPIGDTDQEAMEMEYALGEQDQNPESREDQMHGDNSVSPQSLVPLRCPDDGKTRPYSCDLCDRAFTAKSSLREHLFLHYGKPFPCDLCERQFTRKMYLVTHMKEIHPEADTTAVEQSGLDSKYEEIINKALDRYPYIEPKRSTPSKESKIQATPPSELPYPCKVCGKSFQFSATLQKHMRAHVKLKPLLCDFCERRFVRQTYLDEHIRTQHPPGSRSKDPNKPFKCETCDLAFSKRSYLKDHRYRHKLKKPFPCTFCSKSFRRRCILQVHISRHHSTEYRKLASESVPKAQSSTSGTLKVRLPFQKQKFGSSSSLKKDPLMCYECGTTFSCRANVRRHMRIHSGYRPFKCQFCPWTFNRKEVLQGHIKKKHSDKPKAQGENVKIKFKVISGGHRGHQCQKCGGVYKTPYALKAHMKQHISSSTTNPIQCTYCDLSFQRDVDLIKHNRFVHGIVLETHSLPPTKVKKIKEEPGKEPSQSSTSTEIHVCHRCGSRFDSFWGLDSHSRVHEKHSRFPRPYKCVECGAAFKGLSNHTRHMRVHTPEYIAETKKLLNSMPGKKSRVQSADPTKKVRRKFSVPSKIVDPERKHVCPKCGTAYKYARNLRKHVARHAKSSDRPYQCSVCGIYGKTRGSISKHLQIHRLQASSSLSVQPEESKAHICKRCGAAFNTKQLLLSHMTSHTDPNPSQPIHRCKHCNAEFKHRGALTIHERSHASLNFEFVRETNPITENHPTDTGKTKQVEKQLFVIKELKCPVCEKTFTRRSGVSNHIKTHSEFEFVWQDDASSVDTSEEKPYQCGVCLIRFRMKSSLSNHMNSHRSEERRNSNVMNEPLHDESVAETNYVNTQATPEARPYSCTECSCTFRNVGHLKTHMRVHMYDGLGKRNHVCDVCQCRFSSSTNLKKHKRVHLGFSTTSTTLKDPASVYSKLEHAESIDVKTKRPFKCRMCGETFKAKHLLDEHIQTHSLSPRQSQFSTKQKESATNERVLGSPEARSTSGDAFTRMVQRPYACPICHDRFKLKSTRYKHIRLHRQSEGKPYRCSTCGLGFFSVGNMTKHLKRVHGKVSNLEEPAVMTTPSKTPVFSPGRGPLSASKKRPFACKYCGDTFTMRCNMNRHRKRHETGDNLPYRCSHCGFGFKSTKERTKHILRAHSNQESRPSPSIHSITVTGSGYKCPLCGDTFKESSGMYKHMRVHARSTNKPYKCGVCRIGYNTVVGLTRHKGRVNHGSPTDEDASNVAPREPADVKPNKERLDAQMQNATKRYKCRYCPTEYRDRSSVWRHEQVHKQGPTKSRPFPCKVCGYSCYTQVYLNHHMQFHRKSLFANAPQSAMHTDLLARKTGTDRCKRCGLCFKTKSLFLVHIKRCSRISPFACKICSVRFSNQIMLTKHVRQVHKEVQRDVIQIEGRNIIRETGHDKKFCCDQCDARYKRPSEIEKHLRRHALGFIKPQVGFSSPVMEDTEVDDNQTMSTADDHQNEPLDMEEVSPEVRPSLESIRESLSPGRVPVHNRTARSNKARPFVCPTCGFAFMTVIHLRKHTRLHKVAHTKPFVCKICTLGYSRLLDYHRHCNVVHPWRKGSPNEIRCPRCKQKFNTKTELVEHLEKETCKFTDDVPEAATESTDQLEASTTMDANDEPNRPDTSNRELKCPICGCPFLARAHLETHMKVHDNWESQPFRCERCKLGYSTKQHITKHLNLNPLCLKLSKQREQQSGSVSTAPATQNIPRLPVEPPKKTGKSLECPHCGKGFLKRSQLNFHIELHTPSPDRPHVCAKCGVGYKTMPNYVKHMKWENSKSQMEHGKLRAAIFMCRDCGYSVTNKALLIEHNQFGCPNKKSNPAVEAPKACPVCGNFFTSNMMCIHLHGHLYDKLVQCSQCPLRFSLPEDKEKHEKEHPDWNQMLLDLLSSEFSRKLNPEGKTSQSPVRVKIEPGLEGTSSYEDRPTAPEEARKENAIPRIKPEPVDEPEYNYDLGALRNSSLGDYHALLPDASESSIRVQPQKQAKKANSQAASVSRLEQIVSNLAAQRPQQDAQSEPVPNALPAPITTNTNNVQEASDRTSANENDNRMPEGEDYVQSVESISRQVIRSVPSLSPRAFDPQPSTTAQESPKVENPSAPKQTLYRCRYCPAAFRLKGLCMAHERTVHRKIYSRGPEQKNKPVKDISKMSVCEICNAVFEQRSSLSRHMLFKHGKPLKSAEESDNPGSGSSQAASSSSVSLNNASQNGPFITNVTSQGMSENGGNSSGHMSILQQRLQAPPNADDYDELQIHASQPSTSSQNKSKLEALLTGSLDPTEAAESSLLTIRPYKCKGCKFAFTQRHHLVRHIKRKSCAFHVLGRKAAAQLKSNQQEDEDVGVPPVKIKVPEKKHKCPMCPRAFWKKSRLENHMKIHEGVGFFQCQYCSKEFRFKNECATHEEVCPSGPRALDLEDYATEQDLELDPGEEMDFEEDRELDQAQEEAFMDDPDQNLGYMFGGDEDGILPPTSNGDEGNLDWTDIRIKEEPLDEEL